jgi:uncharacterized protein DUF4012
MDEVLAVGGPETSDAPGRRASPAVAPAWLPLPIGVVAGVTVAFGPIAPTGSSGIDAVFIVAAVTAIVVVARRSPWWAVAVAAGAAMAIAIDPLLMVCGAVALGVALWAGRDARQHPVAQAASVGVACNVLARAELDVRLGVSAAVGVAALGLVFVTGLGQHSTPVRRAVWAAVLGLLVLAGAASAVLGYTVYRSKDDLVSGQRAAELGVSALEHDDFTAAADYFRQAAELLDRAHGRMSSVWTAPAALVPVVGQHRSAVVDLSGVGGTGAHTVADALDEIDLDELRPRDGRIDVAALEAVGQPLQRVDQALVELQEATVAARSPWLVPPAVDALDDFTESIDEHLPSLDRAIEAIGLAPQMLGATAPRDYLVLFTTPAESRGLGGMPGSYAVLHADGGALSLGEVGRVEDLDSRAQAAGAVVHGHEAFLAQYGRFGYDAGAVGNAAFRNLTMSPDFPTVASIAADLYQQTTGQHVDGVVAVDATVFATLLRYTGPIQLTTLPETLGADNATDFLLRGQYVAAEGDTELRSDALGEAASQTFQQLIRGSLPEPIALARDMGPLVSARNLMMWSAAPDEQALLLDSNAAGQMPTLDGANGWSVTVTNAAGNKIDSYLRGTAEFAATTDSAGTTTSQLRLELTNTAPSEGLPRYIIGNRLGLPLGTSRLYVSLYSATPLASLTVDGVPTGVTVGSELGWYVYSLYVELAPGQARAFDVRWAGAVADPGRIVTLTQPLASPISTG